jgi:hypothetical protein
MSKVIFHTDGKRGLWSDVAKAVTVTNIDLGQGTVWEGDSDDEAFGELRVYFDTATWDTQEDGLIYTDTLFLKELQEFLNAHGLPGKDVCYSEQGMQGDDYVSLDAGGLFYKAWMAKFGVPREQMIEVY